MHPEDRTVAPETSPDDPGVEAGEAIRRRVQAIFSDAERQARTIEQAAGQRGQRAAGPSRRPSGRRKGPVHA